MPSVGMAEANFGCGDADEPRERIIFERTKTCTDTGQTVHGNVAEIKGD